VPWCDDCAKFWNPPSLHDGACPTCGAALELPTAPAAAATGTETRARAPWHFKMLLVATVVYLGYRLYQGVFWLAHHV
jgi:hypothetical protein